MRTYREQQAHEHGLTMRQLINSRFASEACDEDANPKFHILAAYYCNNGGCPVRGVVVDATWPDGDRPERPKFTCPGCWADMEFIGHRRYFTLLQIEDEEPAT